MCGTIQGEGFRYRKLQQNGITFVVLKVDSYMFIGSRDVWTDVLS